MKNKKFTAAMLVAATTCLVSCASSGLYNMSEDWCARHIDASATRCPENEPPEQRTAGIPPANGTTVTPAH